MGASQNSDRATPEGRIDVTAAVLSVTERLCATGHSSSFTVRQIATEAEVTTSLQYWYFKSKDEIIFATVTSISAELDTAVAGEADVASVSSAVSRMLDNRPAFPRLLAWLVLEGRSFADLSNDPLLGRLIAMFTEGGSSDPRTDAGAVVAMLLGNALFGGDVNVALDRPTDDAPLIVGALFVAGGVVLFAGASRLRRQALRAAGRLRPHSSISRTSTPLACTRSALGGSSRVRNNGRSCSRLWRSSSRQNSQRWAASPTTSSPHSSYNSYIWSSSGPTPSLAIRWAGHSIQYSDG